MTSTYRCTAVSCPTHVSPDHRCATAENGGAGAFRCSRVRPPCPTHAHPDHRCAATGAKDAFSCGRVDPPCPGHAEPTDGLGAHVCTSGRWTCSRVMPPCEGHRRAGLRCAESTRRATKRARAGAAERTLEVGLNLPWSYVYCGYDFGVPPPGWRSKHPSPRNWERDLGPALREAHAAGVRVLRFFVLADGLSYPEGRSLTDFVVLHASRPARDAASKPSFVLESFREDAPPLPPLSDAFVADVRALLDLCLDIGLRAIPSFLSFEAFFPAEPIGDGVVKHGRGTLVLGADRGASPEHLADFFAATLDRLLAIPGPGGEARHPAVLAWELVNEPDWAVEKGHVTPAAMSRFLGLGVDRIVAAGFVASVGFVRANVKWMLPELGRALAAHARAKRYLHQLHHYPRAGAKLPHASDSPVASATIVGEMASNDSARARWPDVELRESEEDPEGYLLGRLERVEAQGYSLALLWSRNASDDKSGFDASIARQVAAFVGGS